MAGILDDLAPRDPLMRLAWADCLRWAVSDPDVLAAFRAATGNQWTPGASPLDRMIDEASGAEAAFVRAFVVWHNETIWGDETEPTEDA